MVYATVIPANAGIQRQVLDTRVRGCDAKVLINQETALERIAHHVMLQADDSPPFKAAGLSSSGSQAISAAAGRLMSVLSRMTISEI